MCRSHFILRNRAVASLIAIRVGVVNGGKGGGGGCVFTIEGHLSQVSFVAENEWQIIVWLGLFIYYTSI